MKKVIALFLLVSMLIISSNIVFAEMHWGIKGGANSTTFTGDDVDQDNIAAFNAGVYTAWRFMDVITVQPELLFTIKGGESTLPDQFGGGGISNVRLNYLELPILFKYAFPMDPFEVNVFAGPYVAHLMMVTDAQGRDENNLLKDFTRFDWGFVLGVGGGMDIGLGRLVADVRYTLGLQNLDDDGDADVKNSVIGANVGWEF